MICFHATTMITFFVSLDITDIIVYVVIQNRVGAPTWTISAFVFFIALDSVQKREWTRFENIIYTTTFPNLRHYLPNKIRISVIRMEDNSLYLIFVRYFVAICFPFDVLIYSLVYFCVYSMALAAPRNTVVDDLGRLLSIWFRSFLLRLLQIFLV